VREQESRRGHRQRTDQPATRAVTRGTSPTAGLGAIGAGSAVSRQAMLVVQQSVGNRAAGRLLEQQGHQHDAACGHIAQRAVVQRVPAQGADLRTRAIENMRARGWEWNEAEGGYTRAPQPEPTAGREQREPAPQGKASASGVTLPESGGASMTMHIHAKKKASFRDPEYFNRVGHSWVSFNRDKKFDSSVGFYPKSGMLDPDSPLKSVPGGVRVNYDDPSEATTTMSVELTEEQYDKAREYVSQNASHDYNLGNYNCTDFAARVYKAATGHTPPGGNNLLIPNNPNDLHAGMKKHNQRQG